MLFEDIYLLLLLLSVDLGLADWSNSGCIQAVAFA